MHDKPDKSYCTNFDNLITYAKNTTPAKPMPGKTPGKRGC